MSAPDFITCPDCHERIELRQANGMVCYGRRDGGCAKYQAVYGVCACGTMMVQDAKHPTMFFRAPDRMARPREPRPAQGKLF